MDQTRQKHSVGEKIGTYIKYQRQKKGYSLTKLSQMTGFDTSFIMRLEKGIYHNVKWDVVEKFAGAFHMRLEEFLIKCRLISHKKDTRLPSLEFYLKEKFQFPDEAIEDFKIMIDVIQNKYKEKIDNMKKQHLEYWDSRN